MKVFIGGSISIKYLDYAVKDELDKYMNNRLEILVGDAYGIDSLVQSYCKDYELVTVYASNGRTRSNVGKWNVRAIEASGCYGREFYEQKDKAMTADCDFGFMVWDGKSKGTLANIRRLIECGKGVIVYLNSIRQMKHLNTYSDYKKLVEEMA